MKIIASFLLMLIITSLNAADSLIMNVDYTDTKFRISLPVNHSTGYEWYIKSYDKILLRLVSSRYVPSPSQMIGSGGDMIFNFELNPGVDVPDMTSLVFMYAQPWQPEAGFMKTVTINFQANAPRGR